MIKVSKVDKSFDGFQALNRLDINVRRGSIYGLVGTNGSGKTTIIKHITGVLKPDDGEITIDGEPVFENEDIKRRVGFIPDDLNFYNTYNLRDVSRFYSEIYPAWDQERFDHMITLFNLDPKRKIARFSKGMQKQAAFSLVMSTKPDVLILDEPIDGLDPIVRKLVWKFIVDDVADREMTVLISSHNLKELEGICDCIGILSHGTMVLERDLDDLRSDVHKVQLAFDHEVPELFDSLNIMHRETRGTVELLIVKNKREEIEEAVNKYNPLIFDVLPLSLEEIFIYELGGVDSEIQGILF